MTKYLKKYLKEHKKEKQLYDIEYRKTHKKQIKKYQVYYAKKFRQKKRFYRKTHRKQINKTTRNYLKNPINKLRWYFRHRIWSALKGKCKFKHSIDLLGCSIEFLKKYIEKQFIKGMSWENYGLYGWHIDHIKQCCTFDLSKSEEQLKCFNYKNLRPLWAKDNYKRPKRD